MSKPFKDWENGVPPRHWARLLAMDVGGATANALEFSAICPDTQTLIFYAEVYKITTDMRLVADLTLPLMRPAEDESEYNFIAKVGDYENRVALADMGRYGIAFTNAVKHNKLLSVGRLSGYLHPNPKRPFPAWHPRAGQLGAPLMFITPACKHLIEEIPQQKWKKDGLSKGDGSTVKDELDRSVRHDAVDCALYTARILPTPAAIPIPKIIVGGTKRNLQSELYWADVQKQKDKTSSEGSRKKYNPAHQIGGDEWKVSLLGFLPRS